MNYYNEIKNSLINNEIYKRVKDYSKNKNDLDTYYKVGKLLSEAGKHYGEGIIKKYSERLTKELGKGYNASNLKRFRKFYLLIQKGATLSHQLLWSQYVEIIPINDINEINYYIYRTEQNKLSVRALRIIIKNKEYERLSEETKNKIINQQETNIKDLVPNPIIIRNKNNLAIVNEKVLHKVILEDIESFLKELGNNYAFIGSEYKIKCDDRYNYIDFLLYNIEYMCYVVVELKITELRKEHIGQIEFYMNYIDNNLRKVGQEKTVGIVICKKNNRFVVAYCSNKNIVSTTYLLV